MAARVQGQCPRCHSSLRRRRRRRGLERVIGDLLRIRPYYCAKPSCGWRGWLSVSASPPPEVPEFMESAEWITEKDGPHQVESNDADPT